MKALIKLTVFMLITATAVFAQKNDYSSEPGYIDFGDFESLESGEMVAEVIIEEHLLRMVAKMARNEDEELYNLLSGLKLVKVSAFTVTEENEKKIQSKIDNINDQLNNSDWDRIVRFRDKEESANVYIRVEGEDSIVGLVVATYDKYGEAAFVNIVGDINLETIGRLGNKFDVPGLDHISGD